MTKCKICNGQLTGRQKETCSRKCRIKLDGIKRKESGRLRKANMTPEAYERKQAAAKKDKERNGHNRKAQRVCTVCKSTVMLEKQRAKTTAICKQCSYKWKGIPPSTSTEIAKVRKPRFYIPTVIPGGTLYQGRCIDCGTAFWNRNLAKYCNRTCKERYRAKLRGDWITLEDRLAIYERDNYTCQLCLLPVPKGYDYGLWGWSAHAPSIDHIIPRSKGGPDSPPNLQLAHSICNINKGATY